MLGLTAPLLATASWLSVGPPDDIALSRHNPTVLPDFLIGNLAGIALAGWDRTGWSRPWHLLDHWMRLRDRRALLAVVVLSAAYLAALLYGFVVLALWVAVAAFRRR